MFEIIEWSEITKLIEKYLNVRYTKERGKPDLFGKAEELWIELNDCDDLENIEVLEILEKKMKFEGDLYIITNESHSENLGAFKVHASNIHKFINNYWEMYGGYFVNNDLLIFNFDGQIVWLYHHSNFYYVLEYSNDINMTRSQPK
ncbi:MAG: hypothetical protein ACRDA5_01890 [Clostridium sp.]